ncbi:MAG: PilZ domain-containing protein [Sphingomonadaceae bacterium]|nr:PilZ domain-containing protein [Sphingomonadaceae bacterium]
MSEGSIHRLASGRAFARFRSRRLCVLVAGTRRDPVRLRDISAAGATLDTMARPPLGESVRLHHPEAGEISARVARHTREGIGLSFEIDETAVSFAMLALAIDMTDRR